MKKRMLLIALAVLLPLVVAVALVRYSLPQMLTAAEQKTIAIEDAPARTIPVTLPEAQKAAVERLAELKKMNQKEWDRERARIPHKYPPETIGSAITRAELRVTDLLAMTDEGWKVEREKLVARDKERLAKKSEKSN